MPVYPRIQSGRKYLRRRGPQSDDGPYPPDKNPIKDSYRAPIRTPARNFSTVPRRLWLSEFKLAALS